MTSLAEIDAWLEHTIAPLAQQIDFDSAALFTAFRQMGDRNLLALRLPKAQGGEGWDEQSYSQFQILIASYSGALAFLSTQHQSAIRMLGNSPNDALTKTLLPNLISGKVGLGVGFSQLRRAGMPWMTAVPTQNGYLLSGTVPWVTGWGCFEGFICGAVLPTQEILMGWVPLTPISPGGPPKISPPMTLAAMTSTQTVEVQLDQWWIDSGQVIAIHPPDWLAQKDQGNILHHGFYALGAAKAALNLMTPFQDLGDSEIRRAIASFAQRFDQCESRMFDLLPHQAANHKPCLEAKASAMSLAGRCAQAAIALVGGSANHQHHPAQRIYREVLAFTVFGQTPASKIATLAALSSFS